MLTRLTSLFFLFLLTTLWPILALPQGSYTGKSGNTGILLNPTDVTDINGADASTHQTPQNGRHKDRDLTMPKPNGTVSSATPVNVTIYPSGGPVEVVGLSEYGLDTFVGIPYAQPPIGELRFAAPQPAKYTNQTIDATKPGPACLQDLTLVGDPLGLGISEDCLTINVLAPSRVGRKASLPVLVYLYGGAFVNGEGVGFLSPFLASRGVLTDRPFILVTFNYRVGLFGFGYGKQISDAKAGNLGLRDQILALYWVQDHIASFGGDPRKVTVFGQSAGAVSISLLMLMRDLDLFRGAIMQSGAQSTIGLGPTATTHQAAFDALSTLVNCSNQTNLDCLKKMDAVQLHNATVAVRADPRFAGGFPFSPSIDGELITESPFLSLTNGKFTHKPFITGNTKDEGTLFAPQTPSLNSTEVIAAALSASAPNPPPPQLLAEIISMYPNDPAMGSPFDTGNETFGLPPEYKMAAALFGDLPMQSRRRFFLQQANQYGLKNVWSYQFEGPVPGLPPVLGITHASDIQYVFGWATKDRNFTAAEVVLGQAVMDYWINFAYYLDPNGHPKDLAQPPPHWASHNLPENMNSMRLAPGNITIIQDDFRRNRTDFMNKAEVAQAFNFRRGLPDCRLASVRERLCPGG